MNDYYKFWRLVILGAIAIALIAAFSNKAHAGTAQVDTQDLKEVITYTTILEAENAQMKQSLETERVSADKMLSEFEAERKASAQYAKNLENENATQTKEITKLQKRGTVKNYIIAILTAAVVTLAVTH